MAQQALMFGNGDQSDSGFTSLKGSNAAAALPGATVELRRPGKRPLGRQTCLGSAVSPQASDAVAHLDGRQAPVSQLNLRVEHARVRTAAADLQTPDKVLMSDDIDSLSCDQGYSLIGLGGFPAGWTLDPAGSNAWRVWNGSTLPRIYYDSRQLVPRAYVSMHAKCVVVDTAECLITSANFTDRAHSRNIELGLHVTDRLVAQRIEGHWRRLIGDGHLERYRAPRP